MQIIHSTAKIHPTAVIGENVEIHANVYIGAYSVIGMPAEHKGYWGKPTGKVVIMEGCVISNHVTIDAGTEQPTIIKDSTWMLKGSHAGHDVLIEEDCVISCGAMIGGHAIIRRGTNIGMNAVVHQWVEIPEDCMIAMGAGIHKNTPVEPNSKYIGNPARIIARNK